jgi:hypothetical protein
MSHWNIPAPPTFLLAVWLAGTFVILQLVEQVKCSASRASHWGRLAPGTAALMLRYTWHCTQRNIFTNIYTSLWQINRNQDIGEMHIPTSTKQSTASTILSSGSSGDNRYVYRENTLCTGWSAHSARRRQLFGLDKQYSAVQCSAVHTGRSPAKSGHSIRPPDWVPWDLHGSNGSHGTCMCPTVAAATLVGGRIELAASK